MSAEGTTTTTSTSATATMTTTATTPEPKASKRGGSFAFFRGSSKKPSQANSSGSAAADAASGDTNVVRKSKSFKRIRGLLNRGESRKERRERRARERAARSSSSSLSGSTPLVEQDDDASTVFGVDVDERSLATAPPAAKDATAAAAAGATAKKTNQTLLDTAAAAEAATKTPTTNQYETVTNDEDEVEGFATTTTKPSMLKVVLLLMDPQTRRFELLQLEFDSQKALVSDVLQQIPVSVTEQALRVQTYTGICGKEGKEMPPQALLASYAVGNDVLVAIPSPLQAKECARLARPILSDEKVVSMLLSSGIDAKGWREKKKKRKTHHHHNKSKGGTTSTTTTNSREEPSTSSSSSSNNNNNKSSSSSSYTFFILVAVILAIVLQVFHLYISAPIKTGHVLSPGIWLTKCGVLGAVNTAVVVPLVGGGGVGLCGGAQQQDNNNNAYYLHLNATDGHVRCYNAQQELVWEMEGGVCSNNNKNNKKEEDGKDACLPGLQVKDDHTLVVGGKPIRTVNVYQDKPKHHHHNDDDALFSPWPFAELPKIKKLYKKQPH